MTNMLPALTGSNVIYGMGMIFLPLPVIPALRIRPEGLFDVTTFEYVS